MYPIQYNAHMCHDRGVGQTYYQDSTIQVLTEIYQESRYPFLALTTQEEQSFTLGPSSSKQQRSNREARTTTTYRSKASSYILLLCPSSVQAAEGRSEGREQPASEQSMNSDMFPNAIHRRDTSTLRQTLDKDTCRSRRNTIQIATHGHDISPAYEHVTSS